MEASMMEENDKLPLNDGEEEEMSFFSCPACVEHNLRRVSDSRYASKNPYREPLIEVVCRRGGRGNYVTSTQARLHGIITCLNDGHQRPITLINNVTDETSPNLPVTASTNLNPQVPSALVQDVKDAEGTFFAQVYRSSVMMCRRALQLSFQEKPHNIKDATYSTMLKKLMALPTAPLSPGTHGMAVSIGDYGGTGAHDPKPVSADEARITIFATVRVLNELFP